MLTCLGSPCVATALDRSPRSDGAAPAAHPRVGRPYLTALSWPLVGRTYLTAFPGPW